MEKALNAEDVLPILNKLAELSGLQVFVFSGEELKKYHTPKNPKHAVALLSKNKDNAIVNLRRLSRCYVIDEYATREDSK